MQVHPISPDRLAELLADRIAALPGADGTWQRVAVDGAAAARPGALADALVEPLRLRGRPALRVSAADFLRPASVRLEYGRQDADAFHDLWLDDGALLREVLAPLDPGGTGRVLPSLRDPVTDRSTRAPYRELPPGGVLLLDGALLLGRWLPFELTVHLALTPAALARRTAPEEQWTLPAFARYEAETGPAEAADVTVRVDDPRHPALVEHP
ncbi:uridine kinase [Kitasatospora sp. A2-31]|uniref:uridine kinase n=1 Tax=Kitasatospora sp. A2-31 TaxID=2916414 RepID=UPI001EEA4585|nr:uridine kinase [Kitasatospora sp. A2-31]MCG6498283.1 uridine kinase [Kitasatospora sp. A2-31]MCG6500182.1 uridine kinase [Kitasatospora sp. A2-31]MCG6500419.1 uridine kinase [Kitasatospora sp. A2-31]